MCGRQHGTSNTHAHHTHTHITHKPHTPHTHHTHYKAKFGVAGLLHTLVPQKGMGSNAWAFHFRWSKCRFPQMRKQVGDCSPHWSCWRVRDSMPGHPIRRSRCRFPWIKNQICGRRLAPQVLLDFIPHAKKRIKIVISQRIYNVFGIYACSAKVQIAIFQRIYNIFGISACSAKGWDFGHLHTLSKRSNRSTSMNDYIIVFALRHAQQRFEITISQRIYIIFGVSKENPNSRR